VRRLESSVLGRVVLTLVMAALVAAIVVWNAPDGPAIRPLKPLSARVLLPVGLDQDWAVFAPEPRGFTVGVYAVVTRQDGTRVTWRPPAKGLFFAPYRTYRWQKYVERLRADDNAGLWEPAARAIAADVGGGVRRVELVRTFRDSVVPGSNTGRPPTQRFTFYTLTLP
jgi:hypothetical protein